VGPPQRGKPGIQEAWSMSTKNSTCAPVDKSQVARQPSVKSGKGSSMERSLRIITADDDLIVQEYYQQALPALGHEIVAVVNTGAELIEQCALLHPDLVITDIKMPDMDGINAAAKIYEQQPLPIILVSGYHDADLIERAAAEHILAYLLKPVRMDSLKIQIAIAMRRFEEFAVLRMEADHYRQTLQDRKLIERAKGIVMKKAGVEEHEAFERLRKLAIEKNKKLVELAQMIVTTESALGV
jgi:AmiR/NasT family two-component response regulator